jgi:hypothetical protein
MGELFTHRQEGHHNHHLNNKPNKAKPPKNKVCKNTNINSNVKLPSSPMDVLDSKLNTLILQSSKKVQMPTSKKKQKKSCGKTKKTKKFPSSKYKDAAITNSLELEREWKSMCRNKLQTLQYLTAGRRDQDLTQGGKQSFVDDNAPNITITIPNMLRLSPEQVSECLCRVEMESGMMGDILIALEFLISLLSLLVVFDRATHVDTSAEKRPIFMGETSDIVNFAYRWLRSISLCGRFSLNVEFLNDVQKQCAESILQVMEHELNDGGKGHFISYNEIMSVDHILALKSKFGF